MSIESSPPISQEREDFEKNEKRLKEIKQTPIGDMSFEELQKLVDERSRLENMLQGMIRQAQTEAVAENEIRIAYDEAVKENKLRESELKRADKLAQHIKKGNVEVNGDEIEDADSHDESLEWKDFQSSLETVAEALKGEISRESLEKLFGMQKLKYKGVEEQREAIRKSIRAMKTFLSDSEHTAAKLHEIVDRMNLTANPVDHFSFRDENLNP